MSNPEYRPAYKLLRILVSEHGGIMKRIQRGESSGGSWFIKLKGKETYFPIRNKRCPGLDELYFPKKGIIPKTWDDYDNILLPNAWDLLIEKMKFQVYYESGDDQEFFDELIDL